MKLIFFALLSSPTLFCCFVFASLGSHWTYLEVAGRNGESPTTISIFSTPRSIFRKLVLFLDAKFVFLEIHHTGPVSCFVRIGSHPIGVAVALVRSVSLQGPSVWRFQFFACAIFSNKCYYFEYNIFFSYLRILGTLRHSDRIHDHFFACRTRWRRPFGPISRLKSRLRLGPPKKKFGKFFPKKEFLFCIVCVYVV